MNNSINTYKNYIVGILGQSNVGKSTLINILNNKKISIVSKKLHTTRNIISSSNDIMYKNKKIYFYDTPGINFNKTHTVNINKILNKIALNILHQVHGIIFVIDKLFWSQNDEFIYNNIKKILIPIIIVINKIDNIKTKEILLPFIKFLYTEKKIKDIIPISAKYNINIDKLLKVININITDNMHCYSNQNNNNIPVHSKIFFISEIIREATIFYLYEELPNTIAVQIEYFEINKQEEYIISGVLIVNKNRHKKILIGKKGEKIKNIIILSKKLLFSSFNSKKINLTLWIKVENNWINDISMLKKFVIAI